MQFPVLPERSTAIHIIQVSEVQEGIRYLERRKSDGPSLRVVVFQQQTHFVFFLIKPILKLTLIILKLT